MPRSKVSVTIALTLACCLFGAVVGAVDPKKDDAASRINAEKLNALLKARLEAAQAEHQARYEEYMAGRGTLDVLLDSAKRMLTARLELFDKKADQLAAYEDYLQHLKKVEAINKAKFEAGRVAIHDYAQAQYYRLDAEILLLRAKAK